MSSQRRYVQRIVIGAYIDVAEAFIETSIPNVAKSFISCPGGSQTCRRARGVVRNWIANRDEASRQPDMFMSDEDEVSEAIEVQIGRIAFKEKRFAFASRLRFERRR